LERTQCAYIIFSKDSTEIYDEEDEDYEVEEKCATVNNGGNKSYSLRGGTKLNETEEGEQGRMDASALN